MPSTEKQVTCRGVNGSISLSRDAIQLNDAGPSSQPHRIAYHDISAVIVQRKSVVPFATLAILTTVVALIAKFNLIWFIVDLNRVGFVISSVGFGVGLICAVVAGLRLLFVNVLVRHSEGPVVVRLVPARSARRLAEKFSELSAGS